MRAGESIGETRSLMFAKQKLKRKPPIFGIPSSSPRIFEMGVFNNHCNSVRLRFMKEDGIVVA